MESRKESHPLVSSERKARIAMLNDRLRVHGIGGKIMITQGIANMGKEMIEQILQAMHRFSDWTKDNDPYGEHDFGAISLEDGMKVFFKIDYYDAQMKYGSVDPADPEKTIRVLTLMLAEEY